MSTSSAFWSYGSAFQTGDAATPTEAFTTVAEVQDITPPSLSKDATEVTNQDSSNGYREFISGFRDGGELTFDCNWLPNNATQDETTGLLEQFNDNVCHNYKLILPDTALTITFAGFVTNYEPDLPLEEQGALSVTIKITGKPLFA